VINHFGANGNLASYSSGNVFFNPDDVKYHFSGHETFPFRYTWLPKGVQKVQEYPDLFTRDEAVVILGVGKNMVSSIRHWCETLKLINSPNRGEYEATELGIALFDKNGWDPYLEDPGTLWLLHWLLASRLDRASTWCLAFTRWSVGEFTRDQLAEWIWKVKSESPSSRGTKASLKRDIDVFLRTYVPSKVTYTRPIEDTFDCPLVELGLISEISKNAYQFERGPKQSLPDEIFLFALLDFWQNSASSQSTLSFEATLHAVGSPGGAFKFTENALAERLERLPNWCRLSYGDTAGRRMIVLTGENMINLMQVLSHYYDKGTKGIY
jgi:hypothetical protein